MPEILKEPIIISGIISGVCVIIGVLVGFVLSQFSSFFQMKAQARERFFYEVFPKRLAVYEDVIKYLSVIKRTKNVVIPIKDIIPKISAYSHKLEILLDRLRIYGSPTSISVISSLMSDMYKLMCEALDIDDDEMSTAPLLNLIYDAMKKFTESVQREAGANLVDKEIVKHLGKVRIKAKKHKNTTDKKNTQNDSKGDQ
jgi:uncharacterized membrane protein